MVAREEVQYRYAKDDTCEKSADLAVKKVFSILGVDIDKPESVEAFREDLRFGKNLRRNVERGLAAVVTALILALSYATYDGIVLHIDRKAKGLSEEHMQIPSRPSLDNKDI